jgi:hypothetical protein
MLKIHKKNKLIYYLISYLRYFFPKRNSKKTIEKIQKKLNKEELIEIQKRVHYYNKIVYITDTSFINTKINDLKYPKTPKAYFFDTYQFARYFDYNLPLSWIFGDVIHVPDTPSIVKSRPIMNENQNSILLNLDKIRHFVFVNDDKQFQTKRDKLIGRGAIYQSHRIDFYEKYFHHPLCDLGQVNKDQGKPELWYKPKMSLKKHLDYKFILSLQGNDVATNLKWIMSSNSIAVMPKPTIETWFMEGTLVGGKHFIEIKPDFSDLESQLQYYIAHPQVCMTIIENAHEHCKQFFNPEREKLCSLLVLDKYFQNLN